MQLDIYLIRGRGEDGSKFQLAMVKNAAGDYFKGQYDPALQYANIAELKTALAQMVGAAESELTLNELVM